MKIAHSNLSAPGPRGNKVRADRRQTLLVIEAWRYDMTADPRVNLVGRGFSQYQVWSNKIIVSGALRLCRSPSLHVSPPPRRHLATQHDEARPRPQAPIPSDRGGEEEVHLELRDEPQTVVPLEHEVDPALHRLTRRLCGGVEQEDEVQAREEPDLRAADAAEGLAPGAVEGADGGFAWGLCQDVLFSCVAVGEGGGVLAWWEDLHVPVWWLVCSLVLSKEVQGGA